MVTVMVPTTKEGQDVTDPRLEEDVDIVVLAGVGVGVAEGVIVVPFTTSFTAHLSEKGLKLYQNQHKFPLEN